jgi:RNA polymerase sigma-70 factor (ECF subfamily)
MTDESRPASVAQRAAADAEGFARRCWDEHGPLLYATALRLLARPEEAEDAVQDVFVTLLRRPPEIPAEALVAWLRRVTVNRCLDLLRARRRWAREPLEELDPVDGGLRTPAAGLDLRDAVRALPERARLVFVLHDVEGLRHDEVAAALGVSEGTSKSQLFRARELLRRRLGDDGRSR